MADVIDVSRAFETYGFALGDDADGKDVAAECLAMCRAHGATADDLAIAYDTFFSSAPPGKVPATPSSAVMDAFRSHYERTHLSVKKASAKKTPTAYYTYGGGDILETIDAMDADDADASLAATTPGRAYTPAAKTSNAKAAHVLATRGAFNANDATTPTRHPNARAILDASAPKPGTSAFSKRPARRAAKSELNAELPIAKKKNQAQAATVAVRGAPLRRDVRYMRDRVGDKVEMIESRLRAFKRAVERRYPGLDCGGATYAASQDDVTVVGRVVCDSEGKLNEASVMLEGSVETSNGARVRLELRELPRFSLFPGQIVCVQGSNPSGHCLVARRLIASVAPSGVKSTASSPAFGSLSVAIASGPYTCAGDLSYEPLNEFLAYCAETRPDAVVLMGPFVDAEHKSVRGDDAPLDVSFEDVFALRVRDALERFAADADDAGYAPSVVVMPSTRDVTHDAVFPQPPLLSERELELPRSCAIACAPNPGVFSINGVTFAACTQDVLRHLSAAEAAREPASGGAGGGAGGAAPDRMSRLAAHLPGQSSAYPLFPAPAGACLDASLAAHLEMDVTPDVLLVPSDLNPFAKIVAQPAGGVVAEAAEGAPPLPPRAKDDEDAPAFVALNPGRLAKGNIGGTIAHVYVTEGAPEPGARGEQAHAIERRARVDIVRI